MAQTGPRRSEAAFAYIGEKTAQVFKQYFQDFSTVVSEDDLYEIAKALSEPTKWDDDQAAQVLETVNLVLHSGNLKSEDTPILIKWILAHPNRAQDVNYCMTVLPPKNYQIDRLISSNTGQKLVFQATAYYTTNQVVLKCFRTLDDHALKSSDREGLAHPLNFQHPNIVNTHREQNAKNEPFFVEEMLPIILSDDNKTLRDNETRANLLYGIANALYCLHVEHELVHCDVKPTNIGMRDGNYVLLDFGLCRRKGLFTEDTTGTGSLRTRAPELLILDKYDPELSNKTDIWSLGATMFNAFVGRFPLFSPADHVPSTQDRDARSKFEAQLKDRALNQWDTYVVLDEIPAIYRDILEKMLTPDPGTRIDAADLVKLVQDRLAAFIRGDNRYARFSLIEEFQHLIANIPSPKMVNGLGRTHRDGIIKKLKRLEQADGLSDAMISEVKGYLAVLVKE